MRGVHERRISGGIAAVEAGGWEVATSSDSDSRDAALRDNVIAAATPAEGTELSVQTPGPGSASHTTPAGSDRAPSSSVADSGEASTRAHAQRRSPSPPHKRARGNGGGRDRAAPRREGGGSHAARASGSRSPRRNGASPKRARGRAALRARRQREIDEEAERLKNSQGKMKDFHVRGGALPYRHWYMS